MPIINSPGGGTSINLASPGAIGGTTPALGSFTTLTATSATVNGSSVATIPSQTDLPALASWVALFEAKRLAVVADATAISTWTDASGNGRDATQTGSARPVYKVAANGINSQPVIRFTAASSQYMATALGGASLASSFYMVAVVRFTTNTGLQTIVYAGDEAAGKRRDLLKYNSPNLIGFNGYAADISPGGATPTAATAYLVEMIRDGTRITVSVNGVQTCSGSPSLNAFTSTALVLGANGAGAENLDGDIGFAAFLGSAPSAALRAQIWGYASEIYGVSITGAGRPLLVKASATGVFACSTLYDNGTDAGVYGRLIAYATGLEHAFYVSNATHGAMLTQNFNDGGYSDFNMQGEDVGTYAAGSTTAIAPYGFAVGWGNSAATPTVFRGVAYCEAYDAAGSGSFRGFRIIQTASGLSYRRLQVDGSTGDITFYRRDAGYPSETVILTLTESTGRATFNAPLKLKGYTVATLPAGVVGDNAYVTDALAPTFLATVVGGGAITTPVFYNGSNWVGG